MHPLTQKCTPLAFRGCICIQICTFLHEKPVFWLPEDGFFNEIRPYGRVKSTFVGEIAEAVKSRFAG